MIKNKKGFTLVELLAVLIILALISVIVYPRVNTIVEKNKKKAFIESVKSTIRSYDSYLASENYPQLGQVDVTKGIIPTIDSSTWKTGLIEKLFSKIYVENFYDGNFCAFGYEDSLSVYRGECKTTPSSCFEFNTTTKTITGYKLSDTCTKNVIIPQVIKGVNVENIGQEAFSNKGLEYVFIPSSVKSIGAYAFSSNALTSLVVPDTVKTIGNGAFNNNKLPDDQAFIYQTVNGVPNESVLISYGGANKDVKVPSNVTVINNG